MKTRHYLKCETEYYHAVKIELKKFEIRKNDRNFQVGDLITLKEVINGIETGNMLPSLEIKYILHGGSYGLDKDYCIINW